MSNELATTQGTTVSVFANATSFDTAQRIAKALSSSDLVPDTYKGNIANCLVALEAAQRIGASPLMVMQNMHIIHGRPSWSSQFIIAAINSCGRFGALKFRMGTGECTAYATDKDSGEVIEGPKVTLAMAQAEGWATKSGSKWKTMPELMLRYRAAAFFGRLYAPDVLMGMYAEEEVRDMIEVTQPAPGAFAPRGDKPRALAAVINAVPEAVVDEPEAVVVEPEPEPVIIATATAIAEEVAAEELRPAPVDRPAASPLF
jgi:hypothetical protein